MKQFFHFTYLIMVVLVVISCKKYATRNNQVINPNNPAINTSPRVNAGKDTTITLPDNSVILRGIAFDDESKIASYEWTNSQGLYRYTFSTPHLPETIVSDLEIGTYIFELTVRDSMGLSAKDVVSVKVLPETVVNPPGFIFRNLGWGCFGQCYLAVNNLDSFISPNQPLQVYIKRDSSTDWIRVIEETPGAQAPYMYYIEYFGGTTLWIINWNEDGYDTPDIKITF